MTNETPVNDPEGSHLFLRRRLRRRQLLGAMAAGAAALGSDALWREPHRLVVERHTLGFADLPPELDGLKVVHLSDLHHSIVVGQAEIERAVEQANALRPDLVLLTGDYVTMGRHYAAPCAAALAGLQAPLGRYAVLGNHDHWTCTETVTTELQHAGITVLQNQAQPIGRRGAELWVVGVDDAYVHRDDLDAALQGVPAPAFKIALVHVPDLADKVARRPVQLQLSGHTHGGQVCLPGIGPLVLPRLGQKYPMGHRQVGRLQVYTSRGVGRVQPAIRLFCPPEVALLTLRRA
jgi:predicted MPP superfamily phosphohydrolase